MPDVTMTDADLGQAEELAASLAAVLGQFLHPSVGFNADRAAIGALEEWRNYCRPSCSFLEEGDCAMGTDLCSCPCRHDETAAIVSLPQGPPSAR